MSESIEDQKYGLEAVEESQGYTPMKSADPIPKDFDGPDNSGEILKRREEEEARAAETVPINYHEVGGDAKPENETVSAEQAAHDLSRYREGLARTEEELERHQVAEAIDQIRGQVPQEQQQQPQPEVIPEPAPESPEVPQSGIDPALEAALQNPAVRAALEQQYVAVQQQQQAYAAAVQQNAQAALVSVASNFPELQNLTSPDQVNLVIRTIARTDRPRAEAMVRHLENTSRLVQEHNRVYAAQQQQQQRAHAQQFEQFSRAADNEIDAYAKKQGVSADQYREIQTEARTMLKEYGLSDQQLQTLWATSPEFRSFPSQRMMMDAARFRLSQKSLASKQVKTVPTVQRPGVGNLERMPESDYHLDKLNARLNQTGSVKDAAALINARRARR